MLGAAAILVVAAAGLNLEWSFKLSKARRS
jgi:hypothetical protein